MMDRYASLNAIASLFTAIDNYARASGYQRPLASRCASRLRQLCYGALFAINNYGSGRFKLSETGRITGNSVDRGRLPPVTDCSTGRGTLETIGLVEARRSTIEVNFEEEEKEGDDHLVDGLDSVGNNKESKYGKRLVGIGKKIVTDTDLRSTDIYLAANY
ncbi:hypothetical protein OROGR_012988 [Orobanche gracilis]